MTRREEEFLTWLLDPQFFGDRLQGPTRKDVKRIVGAIRLLRSVQSGLLSVQIADLEDDLVWVKEMIRRKWTTHRSPIQGDSHDGRENLEETKRLFLASLIARKAGTKPYELVRDVLTEFGCHRSPNAIEMRVRRFEKRRLGALGPMSCREIARFKYSQFLTVRRRRKERNLLTRYLAQKISYRQYESGFKRLMMPNPREERWLDLLCSYSRARVP